MNSAVDDTSHLTGSCADTEEDIIENLDDSDIEELKPYSYVWLSDEELYSSDDCVAEVLHLNNDNEGSSLETGELKTLTDLELAVTRGKSSTSTQENCDFAYSIEQPECTSQQACENCVTDSVLKPLQSCKPALKSFTFGNSLDPHHAPFNMGTDQDLNCLAPGLHFYSHDSDDETNFRLLSNNSSSSQSFDIESFEELNFENESNYDYVILSDTEYQEIGSNKVHNSESRAEINHNKPNHVRKILFDAENLMECQGNSMSINSTSITSSGRRLCEFEGKFVVDETKETTVVTVHRQASDNGITPNGEQYVEEVAQSKTICKQQGIAKQGTSVWQNVADAKENISHSKALCKQQNDTARRWHTQLFQQVTDEQIANSPEHSRQASSSYISSETTSQIGQYKSLDNKQVMAVQQHLQNIMKRTNTRVGKKKTNIDFISGKVLRSEKKSKLRRKKSKHSNLLMKEAAEFIGNREKDAIKQTIPIAKRKSETRRASERLAARPRLNYQLMTTKRYSKQNSVSSQGRESKDISFRESLKDIGIKFALPNKPSYSDELENIPDSTDENVNMPDSSDMHENITDELNAHENVRDDSDENENIQNDSEEYECAVSTEIPKGFSVDTSGSCASSSGYSHEDEIDETTENKIRNTDKPVNNKQLGVSLVMRNQKPMGDNWKSLMPTPTSIRRGLKTAHAGPSTGTRGGLKRRRVEGLGGLDKRLVNIQRELVVKYKSVRCYETTQVVPASSARKGLKRTKKEGSDVLHKQLVEIQKESVKVENKSRYCNKSVRVVQASRIRRGVKRSSIETKKSSDGLHEPLVEFRRELLVEKKKTSRCCNETTTAGPATGTRQCLMRSRIEGFGGLNKLHVQGKPHQETVVNTRCGLCDKTSKGAHSTHCSHDSIPVVELDRDEVSTYTDLIPVQTEDKHGCKFVINEGKSAERKREASRKDAREKIGRKRRLCGELIQGSAKKIPCKYCGIEYGRPYLYKHQSIHEQNGHVRKWHRKNKQLTAYGGKKEICGGKEQKYGGKEQSYIAKQQSYGAKQQNYGDMQQICGGKQQICFTQQRYDGKQLIYGNKQQRHVVKQQKYSFKQQRYGKQMCGGKQQRHGVKQQRHGVKQQRYGKEQRHGVKQQRHGVKQQRYGVKQQRHGKEQRYGDKQQRYDKQNRAVPCIEPVKSRPVKPGRIVSPSRPVKPDRIVSNSRPIKRGTVVSPSRPVKRAAVISPVNTRIFKCSSCNYSTNFFTYLHEHNQLHRKSEVVWCWRCHVVFKTLKANKIWHARNKVQHQEEEADREGCGTLSLTGATSVETPRMERTNGGILNNPVERVRQTPQRDVDNNNNKCVEGILSEDCSTVLDNAGKTVHTGVVSNRPVSLDSGDGTGGSLKPVGSLACVSCNFVASSMEALGSHFIATHFLDSSGTDNNNNNDQSFSSAIKSTGDDSSVDDNRNVTAHWSTEALGGFAKKYKAKKPKNVYAIINKQSESGNVSAVGQIERSVARSEDENCKSDTTARDDNNNMPTSKAITDRTLADLDQTLADSSSSTAVELLSCLVCESSFPVKADLMKHLTRIHRLTNLCQLCYFKQCTIQRFANPVSLRNHKLRHHPEDMVKCTCGAMLIDKKMLMSHQKKFKCNQSEVEKYGSQMVKCVCGKRFGTLDLLAGHKMKCRKRRCDEDSESSVSGCSYEGTYARGETSIDKTFTSPAHKARSPYSKSLDDSSVDTDIKKAVRERKPSKSSMKEEEGNDRLLADSTGPTRKVDHRKTKIAASSKSKKITQDDCINKDHGNVSSTYSTAERTLSASLKRQQRPVKQEHEGKPKPGKQGKRKVGRRKMRPDAEGRYPCKVCRRRFKRPYLYVHQKNAHQRRQWVLVPTAVSFPRQANGGTTFRCGWCKFVAVHWRNVVQHHYGKHPDMELDVISMVTKPSP